MTTPVIVIVGPTGSGKTGVTVKIAEKVGGEIISADSRAIYRGMDIGTAKPTREEQRRVNHYGIDLVDPGDRFTVADWKKYAENKIEEIISRGKIPFVVGGTGLYIDALVFDYQFTEESKKTYSDRISIDSRYKIFGIKTETEILRQRLMDRVNNIFTQELFEETKKLVQRFGWENQAMKSNIYQFVWSYLEGGMDFDEAKRRAFYDDWGLARRQITWFKRNKAIRWSLLENIEEIVLKCIQDEQRK